MKPGTPVSIALDIAALAIAIPLLAAAITAASIWAAYRRVDLFLIWRGDKKNRQRYEYWADF